MDIRIRIALDASPALLQALAMLVSGRPAPHVPLAATAAHDAPALPAEQDAAPPSPAPDAPPLIRRRRGQTTPRPDKWTAERKAWLRENWDAPREDIDEGLNALDGAPIKRGHWLAYGRNVLGLEPHSHLRGVKPPHLLAEEPEPEPQPEPQPEPEDSAPPPMPAEIARDARPAPIAAPAAPPSNEPEEATYAEIAAWARRWGGGVLTYNGTNIGAVNKLRRQRNEPNFIQIECREA